jgi:ABC-type uncharacterized transport system auxiliary subunit
MMNGKSPSNGSKLERSLRRLVMAGLSALALVSCGGVPKTRYYTVALPAQAPANDARTSFVLDVPRFRAAEVLRDDRILYYQSPTELNYYHYHRWSGYPADLVAEQVAGRLQAMGVFSQIRLFPHSTPGDYVLRGRLLNFEELDYQAGGAARVGLELALVRSRDQKVVWSDSRQSSHAVEEKGVAGVVKALNAACVETVNQLLSELVSAVEQEAKAAPKQSQ